MSKKRAIITEIYEKIELPLVKYLKKVKITPHGYPEGVEPEDIIIKIESHGKKEKIFISIQKHEQQLKIKIEDLLGKVWSIFKSFLEIMYFWKKFK